MRAVRYDRNVGMRLIPEGRNLRFFAASFSGFIG
jgi:hypothetical protein